MIDFKKMTEKLQDQKGYCLVSNSSYEFVTATQVNCYTGVKSQVKLPFVFEHTDRGIVVNFFEGVTGYESFYLKDIKDFCESGSNGYFYFCAGTPKRWDSLLTSRNEMVAKFSKYF